MGASWTRFWGQFTKTINKTREPAVKKFSYHRELLNGNVKRTVEVLPFTYKGYIRVQSILQEKFGKELEKIKEYI